MEDINKLIIPTEYLPANWRNTVAEKFNIKPNMVGKVANGTRNNTMVFDYLLELAEKGRQDELLRLKRLDKINQPVTQ